LAALAIMFNKEKEMANTGIEKDRPTPKKDTPYTKEISPDCCCFLLLLLLFSLHLFFYDFKGIKTKEKDKDKEKSESGPLRSGFWFRVRLRIRIYGPVVRLASKARISMTDFTFFERTFLDMNRYLRKVCLLLA
jgi:hypothetical protein